ncbi:SpaA isopeptide-forming pilin-related protein [Anaerococcus sp. ENR1011]|uniref:SpaA isopeptide-forming pilin-related protein n=1 Tax=Anaerococcus groningensis TaxID=3115616 RepID=A0ABW9MYY6_9FIRM
MKNKLQQFIVKLLAATLAIIMAVPTNVFAISQRKSNTYTAATSVMGVQTQDDTPEEVANTETSLLKSAVSTAESTDYIIEKSASLSKATGKLDYKILVKTKDPSQEFTENQTTTFGITENTDLKDLKVEKVQALDADGKEIDVENTLKTPKAFNNTDNLRTLGITATKPQYGMVYYLSAQLTEEALKNLEEKSPQLALDITIASPNQDIFQTRYSLETTKPDSTEITIDNDGNLVNQTSDLVEKEDNLHLYKGDYKKEEKTLFQTTPAHLVWTDYINAKDDKEFAVDFNLDENQDTENSQIKIDYYEASDKGYVLNQSFSKTVDFTNSLNLTIPQGYIAKVSLTTDIKENTNAKAYTFNGVKVANPTYKEEKTEKTEEEQASDDADPLPSDSSKNNEEAKPSKYSIADERKQDFSQNPKSDTSAIALNKEAYLENLKNGEKLTKNLEKAATDIELALESYNKEETNWDEFKATIQDIAKEQNLDQAQTEEILQALLAGLNEDKYKVANIDTKEATSVVEETTVQSEPADTTGKSVDELAKEKLNDPNTTLEDFQNYMYELEEKYGLTNEDADRIYSANEEAIRNLLDKHNDEEIQPMVLAVLPGAQYTLNGSFPITLNPLYVNQTTPSGTTIEVEHSDYLIKNSDRVKPLYNSRNQIIANGTYDSNKKTITYTLNDNVSSMGNSAYEVIPFSENFSLNSNIKQGEEIVINNKMTITTPDGKSRTINMAPNRLLVGEDYDAKNAQSKTYNYDPNARYNVRLTTDTSQNTNSSTGEVESVDWTVTIDGEHLDPQISDLSQLGIIVNLTGVYGSGLGNIKDLKVNNKPIPNNDLINNKLEDPHINFSYNYKPSTDEGRRKYIITFNTPVAKNSGKHQLLDLTYTLSNINGYNGVAKRFGYYNTTTTSKNENVYKSTNDNRRIIAGEYVSPANGGKPTQAHWTISDAVNADDTGYLPIEKLSLQNQKLAGKIRATYYQKDISGKMIKAGEKEFENLEDLSRGSYPQGINPAGTIVVYDFYTNLDSDKTLKPTVVSGDNKAELLSINQDVTINTEWHRGIGGETIPSYEVDLIANGNDKITTIKMPELSDGNSQKPQVLNLPMWTFDDKGNFVRVNYSIKQHLPEPTTSSDTTNNQSATRRYVERENYFDPKSNTFTLKNSLLGEQIDNTPNKKVGTGGNALWDNTFEPRDITIRKLAKDGVTPLEGAKFKLSTSDSNNKDGNAYRSYEGVTDSNGYVTFYNVEPNDYGQNARYSLTEVRAPEGYLRNLKDEQIVVENTGNVYWETSSNILTQVKPPKYLTILDDYKSDRQTKDGKAGLRTNSITEFIGVDKQSSLLEKDEETSSLSNDDNSVTVNYYLVYYRDGAGVSARDSKLHINPGNARINYIDVKDFDTWSGTNEYWTKEYKETIEEVKDKYNAGTMTEKDFERLKDIELTINRNETISTTVNRNGQSADVKFDHQRFGSGWTYIIKVNATLDNTNLVRPNKFAYTLDENPNWSGEYTTRLLDGYTILPAMKKIDTSVPVPPIEITNTRIPDAAVALTKTDSNNNRLSNATITLEDEYGNTINSDLTNDNGELIFDELRPGTYYIRETQAPDGYKKTGEYYKIVVSNEEVRDPETGDVNNERRVRYQKYDKDGNKIGDEGIGSAAPPVDYESGITLARGVYLPEKPTMTVTKWAKDSKTGKIRAIGEAESGNPGVYDLLLNEGVEYSTHIRFNKSQQGDTFTFDFDDKLNFTFTVDKFPDIVDKNDEVIATAGQLDPVTNKITYTVTDYLTRHKYDYVDATLTIRGVTLNRQKYKDISGTFNTGYIMLDNPIENKFSSSYDNKVDEEKQRNDTYNIPVNFGDYPGKYVKYGTNYSQTYYKDASGNEYQTPGPGRQRYIKYIAYYNANDQYIRNTDGWPRVQFIWNDNMELKEFREYNIPYEIGRDYNRVAMPTSYGIEPQKDTYVRNGRVRNYDNVLTLYTGSENQQGYADDRHSYYRYRPNNDPEIAGPEITNPKLELDLNLNHIETSPIRNPNFRDGKVFEFDFAVSNEDKVFYDSDYGLWIYTRQWLDDYGTLNSQGFGHSFKGEQNEATALGSKYTPPTPNPADINFVNQSFKSGKINIQKTDAPTDGSKKKNLPGAQFVLQGIDNDYSRTLFTDDDGKGSFQGISPGKYILREVYPPEGYTLGEKSTWNVEINEKGEVIVDGKNQGSETITTGLGEYVTQKDITNSPTDSVKINYPRTSNSHGEWYTTLTQDEEDENKYYLTTTLKGNYYKGLNQTVSKTVHNKEWENFMNLSHYAKSSGKTVEYYAILNPYDNGNVDKDTQYNINLDNATINSINDVEVLNVYNKQKIKNSIDNQNVGDNINIYKSDGTLDNAISQGHPSGDVKKSVGTNTVKISIPKERFGNWKFLVRVKANIVDTSKPSFFKVNWTNNSDDTHLKSTVSNWAGGFTGTLTHEVDENIFDVYHNNAWNIHNYHQVDVGPDPVSYTTELTLKDGIENNSYPVVSNINLNTNSLKGYSNLNYDTKNAGSGTNNPYHPVFTYNRFEKTQTTTTPNDANMDVENPIAPTPNPIPPQAGKIRILKQDQDNNPIQGVEFTLYDSFKDALREQGGHMMPSDKDGYIVFDDISADQSFYLKETKAKSGYIKLPTIWKVTYKRSDSDYSIDIIEVKEDSVGEEKIVNKSSDQYKIIDPLTNDEDIIEREMIVTNRRPSYPSTGGSGTFIGFALIGTAVMLAGIAYYGIYVNDKNRRRSNRYDK